MRLEHHDGKCGFLVMYDESEETDAGKTAGHLMIKVVHKGEGETGFGAESCCMRIYLADDGLVLRMWRPPKKSVTNYDDAEFTYVGLGLGEPEATDE